MTKPVALIRKDFAGRLNEALTKLHDCPLENHAGRASYLSNLFNVSSQNSRRWLKGEHMPESTRLEEVADSLRVRLDWLLTGRGLMTSSLPGEDADYSIDSVEVLVTFFEWREKTYGEHFRQGEVLDPEFDAELCRTVCYLLKSGVDRKLLDRRVVELSVTAKRKKMFIVK